MQKIGINRFFWPAHGDILWYLFKNIACMMPPPRPVTGHHMEIDEKNLVHTCMYISVTQFSCLLLNDHSCNSILFLTKCTWNFMVPIVFYDVWNTLRLCKSLLHGLSVISTSVFILLELVCCLCPCESRDHHSHSCWFGDWKLCSDLVLIILTGSIQLHRPEGSVSSSHSLTTGFPRSGRG